MTLTPEQKATLAGWVAAGDNLSTIQKKLAEQFKLTLTYMDVRFLVDDLELTLKDPAPAPRADLTPPPAAPAGQSPAAHDTDDEIDDALPPQTPPRNHAPDPYAEDDQDGMPHAPDDEMPADTNVRVELDNVTVIPNAIASGSVTFTDGVTGKWFVDTYGRPGFTQISQSGYRPTQADAQAFMQELNAALQKRGY